MRVCEFRGRFFFFFYFSPLSHNELQPAGLGLVNISVFPALLFFLSLTPNRSFCQCNKIVFATKRRRACDINYSRSNITDFIGLKRRENELQTFPSLLYIFLVFSAETFYRGIRKGALYAGIQVRNHERRERDTWRGRQPETSFLFAVPCTIHDGKMGMKTWRRAGTKMKKSEEGVEEQEGGITIFLRSLPNIVLPSHAFNTFTNA